MKTSKIFSSLALAFVFMAGIAMANHSSSTVDEMVNAVKTIGDKCDKCGEKDCTGKCAKADAKKSCKGKKKACCKKDGKKCCKKGSKKSCHGKKAMKKAEKKAEKAPEETEKAVK